MEMTAIFVLQRRIVIVSVVVLLLRETSFCASGDTLIATEMTRDGFSADAAIKRHYDVRQRPKHGFSKSLVASNFHGNRVASAYSSLSRRWTMPLKDKNTGKRKMNNWGGTPNRGVNHASATPHTTTMAYDRSLSIAQVMDVETRKIYGLPDSTSPITPSPSTISIASTLASEKFTSTTQLNASKQSTTVATASTASQINHNGMIGPTTNKRKSPTLSPSTLSSSSPTLANSTITRHQILTSTTISPSTVRTESFLTSQYPTRSPLKKQSSIPTITPSMVPSSAPTRNLIKRQIIKEYGKGTMFCRDITFGNFTSFVTTCPVSFSFAVLLERENMASDEVDALLPLITRSLMEETALDCNGKTGVAKRYLRYLYENIHTEDNSTVVAVVPINDVETVSNTVTCSAIDEIEDCIVINSGLTILYSSLYVNSTAVSRFMNETIKRIIQGGSLKGRYFGNNRTQSLNVKGLLYLGGAYEAPPSTSDALQSSIMGSTNGLWGYNMLETTLFIICASSGFLLCCSIIIIVLLCCRRKRKEWRRASAYDDKKNGDVVSSGKQFLQKKVSRVGTWDTAEIGSTKSDYIKNKISDGNVSSQHFQRSTITVGGKSDTSSQVRELKQTEFNQRNLMVHPVNAFSFDDTRTSPGRRGNIELIYGAESFSLAEMSFDDSEATRSVQAMDDPPRYTIQTATPALPPLESTRDVDDDYASFSFRSGGRR